MISLAEFAWAVVLAGGGGAAVALGALKFFGEKWLESRFSGRLQELRHEHEKRIEAIRFRSSESLDRSVKLAEREFEATSEAWGLVTDAHVRTMNALPGYKTSTDFSRLSDKLAEIAAEKSGLEEWEIEALLELPVGERNTFFSERRAVNEITSSKRAIGTASNFVARNALFLHSQIHQEFEDFLNQAWAAMIAWEIVGEIRRQGGTPQDLDGIRRDDEDFRQNSEERLRKLESLVRDRFWPQEAAPPTED